MTKLQGAKPPIRVALLASGRGSNAAAILEQWGAGQLPIEPVCLVCNVPGAGALEVAESFAIEALLIDHKTFASREAFDAAVLAALQARRVDYVVLAGFMRLLSRAFIAAYPQRILNVHPSLLPAFKGAHAVRDALAYGVRVTGVTVHLVDEGLDSGPILLQAPVTVNADDTEDSLHQRIHQVEHELLPEALRRLSQGPLTLEGRTVHFASAAVTESGRASE